MDVTTLSIIIVVLLAYYVISQYNWFQTALTRIQASIQDIGNQLKRQSNLIPNLESAAKGYLKHEKGIYKELTDARKAVDSAVKSKSIKSMEAAADKVSQMLPKLQILVESNPELKGEKVISRLMDELRDTSDKLMYARRTLIDLSADFNRKLVTIPSNIIGNMFKFPKQKGISTKSTGAHMEVSEKETKDVKISL